MLRHPTDLAYPPVTHVHVPGQPHVVRLDALIIEEAREVIISLADQLMVLRHDLAELRQARKHEVVAELRAWPGDGWDGRNR